MKEFKSYIFEKLKINKDSNLKERNLPDYINCRNYREFLNIEELKEDSREWYHRIYPDDELFDEIKNEPLSKSLELFFKNTGKWEDEYCVSDSIIRERFMKYFSEVCGVKYDYFYDVWLNY